MNEPFVDYTFVFLGILEFSSSSDKLIMLVIQMAKSSELGLFLTIEWKLGHAVTTGVGALVVTYSTGVIEHLLVSTPGHGVMRDVMNATLMNKLGQGIMILLDSINKLSLSHVDGTLLEDVVSGPQLVVEDRAGETLQDFLLYKTMHKPFVDDTFKFLGIL